MAKVTTKQCIIGGLAVAAFGVAAGAAGYAYAKYKSTKTRMMVRFLVPGGAKYKLVNCSPTKSIQYILIEEGSAGSFDTTEYFGKDSTTYYLTPLPGHGEYVNLLTIFAKHGKLSPVTAYTTCTKEQLDKWLTNGEEKVVQKFPLRAKIYPGPSDCKYKFIKTIDSANADGLSSLVNGLIPLSISIIIPENSMCTLTDGIKALADTISKESRHCIKMEISPNGEISYVDTFHGMRNVFIKVQMFNKGELSYFLHPAPDASDEFINILIVQEKVNKEMGDSCRTIYNAHSMLTTLTQEQLTKWLNS